MHTTAANSFAQPFPTGIGSVGEAARATLAMLEARLPARFVLVVRVEPDAADVLVVQADREETLPLAAELAVDSEACAALAIARAVGEPVAAGAVLRIPLTVIAEPMTAGAGVIGVLVVAWRERYAELSQRTLEMISMLAREAAVTISQRRAIDQLRELARTDELTGLPNRRAWQEQLAGALARAGRWPGPVSIAIVDLDRFKRYNDELGHDAGDRVLKEASAAWRETLRETDFLARWGGEEFALLLPACPLRDAESAVDRLREATPAGQTCSAGIAQWDGSETGAALLARADRALYEAKAAGRDRAAVAPQPA